jgi:serine/threonine protein kinase
MASLTPDSRSQLLSRLRADQSERWQRGEHVSVEEYLAEYPELASDADALLDLIHSEMLHRLETGDRPSLEEYLQRFPQHADAMRRSLELLQMAHTQMWSDSVHPHSTASSPTANPAMAPTKPPPVLPGFELYEKLGEGGMGVVYRARDLRLDQPRAIKVIRGRGSFAGEEAHDRFQREAKAVARLDHPGVVRIYTLGEYDDLLYICMEYLDGGSLQKHLRQGPLAIRVAADLVCQLTLAVQHAHDNRVLHRDLKPANVLLQKKAEARPREAADGPASDASFHQLPAELVPKIADFGLAKLLDTDDELTQTGVVMGTAPYMAPEQAEGRASDVGPRTDVYALGAILYECLTGRPPFKGINRSETLERVRTRPPTSLRRLRSEVPAELEAICLKCLEKQPGRRYGTAGELAADLQAWLAGKTPRVQPVRGLRRRLLALAAAIGLIALGSGGLLLLAANQNEADPAPVVNTPLQPNVWHPLLTREPRVLHWPSQSKNSHWQFRPDTRELMLSCEGVGLLALGQTTAPRYEIVMTMQQSPWAGNIGLFFGLEECMVHGEPGQRYQYLELVRLDHRDAGSSFRLDWRSRTLIGPPERRRVLGSQLRRASVEFRLTPREHRLEMKVGPGGLAKVSWDGQPLLGLSADQLRRPPTAAEYRGAFGVYVANGNGVFRDAQYLFQEEP